MKGITIFEGGDDVQLAAPYIRNNASMFRRMNGVKFCKDCGEMLNIEVETCKICKGKSFLNGNIAEVLGGYLELSKRGLLKKYLKTIDKKKSGIKMNDKRIALKLLADNKLIDWNDKETEKVVYKAFWKRY